MSGKPNKNIRALIIAMIALVAVALSIAYFYYKDLNQSVDPRIRSARNLYEKYNEFAQASQYDSIFELMDTIEFIYNSYDHYRNSYEVGVLYNNRAASYLSIYLQPEQSCSSADSATLLHQAENSVRKSIQIYSWWLEEFGTANENEITTLIKDDFATGLAQYNPTEVDNFMDRRRKELLEAQTENLRRLSVSYTNLGTIQRHQDKLDSAAIFYKKAMDLWDKNLTAENNLNILLNRPMKKRNIIQKLFPPEK
jgi:hypothetical protein